MPRSGVIDRLHGSRRAIDERRALGSDCEEADHDGQIFQICHVVPCHAMPEHQSYHVRVRSFHAREPVPRILRHSTIFTQQVVARLIEAPPNGYPLDPLQYLIGCYGRAANEQRNNRAAADSPELSAVLTSSKELIVSYAALTMQGVVPQVGGGVTGVARVPWLL